MELEHLLTDVARDAGELLRVRAFDFGTLEFKGKDDPVTELDKEAECYIKRMILEHMPANFLGEEYGLEHHDGRYRFIVDPIDGTKSFVSGQFFSALSIGVEEDGKLIAGVVYDFMRDILYLGYRGEFSILHLGKKCTLDRKPVGEKLRIYAGAREIRTYPWLLEEQFSLSNSSGSIALSMAHLAQGSYDGYIALYGGKGNIWDTVAGYYLLKIRDIEMRDQSGNLYDYHDNSHGIIALRKEVLHLLEERLWGSS